MLIKLKSILLELLEFLVGSSVVGSNYKMDFCFRSVFQITQLCVPDLVKTKGLKYLYLLFCIHQVLSAFLIFINILTLHLICFKDVL